MRFDVRYSELLIGPIGAASLAVEGEKWIGDELITSHLSVVATSTQEDRNQIAVREIWYARCSRCDHTLPVICARRGVDPAIHAGRSPDDELPAKFVAEDYSYSLPCCPKCGNGLCEPSDYDDTYTFATSQDAAITLWQLPDRPFEVLDDEVGVHNRTYDRHQSVASPDAASIAIFGALHDPPSYVRLWRVANGQKSVAILKNASPVQATLFSSDGKWLVVTTKQEISLWNVATGQPRADFRCDQASLEWSLLSPDGRTLAAIGNDGLLFVWDVETGKPIGPVPASPHPVRDIAFTPESRLCCGAGHGTPARRRGASVGYRPAQACLSAAQARGICDSRCC